MRSTSIFLTAAMLALAQAALAAEHRGGHGHGPASHDKAGHHKAAGHYKTAGHIVVERVWARASLTVNGAAYVTLRNTGKTVDRLIGVSTPVAARAELHTHVMDRGIVRMRPLKAIEVHPGAPAVMRPGGHHIMLMGLKRKLKRGEGFPLTLKFAKAGEVSVSVSIEGFGAGGPSKSHHPNSHNPKSHKHGHTPKKHTH